MFLPKTFVEERTEVLHSTMRDIGTAIVVSTGDSGLTATHVPVELDTSGGGNGRLRCHFAKPNPHGEAFAEATDVLVILQGPQAYITPNWYPSKTLNAKVVPTWNYIAIHAYGVAKVYDDAARLLTHLKALTDHFESTSTHPWRVDDAPADYIETMLGGIVGIEIEIDRLEGKWKMSQNRQPNDRQGVVAGLQARNQGLDAQVAAAVAVAAGANADE